MSTFANRENIDELPHYVTFHQGLYCLLDPDEDIQNVDQDLQNVDQDVGPDMDPNR